MTAPVLALLVALVHGPSLLHPFVWTDHGEIVQKALVPTNADELLRTLTMAKGTAKTTARDRYLNSRKTTGLSERYAYYRPVKALSYGLDHSLGNGAPWAFHLSNVVMHLVCCLLLLILVRRIIGRRAPYLAEGVALLQAVNPLHVEAVAWISARSDVMVAGFTLAAAWMLLRARRAPSAGRAFRWRCACGLMAVLAAGSKESGLMCVPILAALSLCLPDDRRQVWWRRVLVDCWLPALFAAGLVAFRLLVVADVHLGALGDRAGLGLWTTLDLFGRNLLMSFIPAGMTVADTVQVLDAPSLLALAGPLAWMAWLLWGVRLRRQEPLVLFCALGWLLSVLPVSQLMPLLHPRADRYLYLPAVFAGLCLVLVLIRLARRPRAHPSLDRLPALGGFLTLCVLAALSSIALSDWQDERRLFAGAVEQQPRCIECWNNLAYAEALAGRYPQAAAACRKGLAVDRSRYRGARDGFSLRWILARSLLLMNRGQDAVVPLEQILVKAGPTSQNLAMLAQAYLQSNRPAHALAAAEWASRLDPADRSMKGLVIHAAREERDAGFPWLFDFPEGCIEVN